MHHLPPKLFSISGILQKCREPCFWKSTSHFCKVRKFEIILCIGGRHPHWGLFLDSVRLHPWPEDPQWHCFSCQFPCWSQWNNTHQCTSWTFCPVLDGGCFSSATWPCINQRVQVKPFWLFFLDFSLTFWILTTLTPSYLLTYVPYSPS